ncbi:MAG: amidase family protein, partial [Gammaproteobacteria bacterium]|nr:amidase family protein [Gammaproteobacteria bacterium]
MPFNSDRYPVQEATISSVQNDISSLDLTCVGLIDEYIDRIEKYDQPTKLNAIIMINPRARERARQLDQNFYSNYPLKPLHCVPVILKDNFDTADMPTAAGSMVLKDSYPPD